MSPGDFRPHVVQAKLHLLDELLADLEAVMPVAGDRLRAERLTRYGVERIVTQLVETAMSINTHLASTLAGKAPPDYRQSFSLAAEVGALSPDLAERLAPSAGLRNLLVHEYGSIDLDRLAQAVPTALNDYRAYVRQMATFLRDRTG